MAGLREALEESYAQIDAGTDADATPDPGVSAEPVPDAVEADAVETSAGGDRPRDETGKFVKADAKPAQEKPSAAPTRAPAGPVAGQGAAAGAVPPPAPAAASAFKAPQSWKAALREQYWGALHPDVQQEIIRREKEAAQALQARAEAEKGSKGWGEAIRPYEAQIRAAGATPEQYVGTLLQTAHALAYGHPQAKADLIAGIVMQYGITPQDLDNALVARMQGRGAAPVQAQPQAQQFRDPRLDEFFAAQETQKAEEASLQADSFAESHEYFNDVAEEVATILDGWNAQGKKHVTEADLERAYRMACAGNEDVQKAQEYRKAQQTAQTAHAATAKAKVAASSIRSQPTAGTPAQPAGRRAALEAAFDELNG